MAGLSNNIYVPIFSGEHFDHWSVKMRTVLMSEDLWECVEEGYEAPNPTRTLTTEEKQRFRENRKNDAKALSLIQRGLSSSYFPRILDAGTAKEAWDILHNEFQANVKVDATAMAPEQVDNELRKDPTSSSAKTHLDEHGTTPLLGETFHDLTDSSPTVFYSRTLTATAMADLDKEEITPLVGEPFYDLVLSKSNIHPVYDMSFPPALDSLLPSTTVRSIIRCFGKTWEVKFCGQRIPKGFDSNWRKFVDDSNLVAGDALVFELLESTSIKVVFKVQILRCTIPPKLQELINKRRAESELVTIDDDDDDDDDE